MEGGKEQNYWPGFVDALSNVVLTLVFVLVIFVFALLMASNKVKKQIQAAEAAEQAHVAAQTELNKALAELGQLQDAHADPKRAGSNDSSQQACLRFSKSDASQTAETQQKAILILFGPNAISVTDDTAKNIHTFIDSYRASTSDSAAKFTIEASSDPNSNSPLMTRETQLGRILNVRNALLSGKVDSHNISIRAVPSLKQKDSYDWVKIYVGK
jgi:type II secretory pathway pseudopilin PulG